MSDEQGWHAQLVDYQKWRKTHEKVIEAIEQYPYEVTISRPRWRYRIQINHGLLTIGRGFLGADIGWWAWTLEGAQRKAERIIASDNPTAPVVRRYEVQP